MKFDAGLNPHVDDRILFRAANLPRLGEPVDDLAFRIRADQLLENLRHAIKIGAGGIAHGIERGGLRAESHDKASFRRRRLGRQRLQKSDEQQSKTGDEALNLLVPLRPLFQIVYHADSFASSLEDCAIKPVMPLKSKLKFKRDCKFALYAERNFVERFFNAIRYY